MTSSWGQTNSNPWATSYQEQLAKVKEKTKSDLASLWDELEAAYPGVSRIKANYNGGGDEGNVDDLFITLKGGPEKNLPFTDENKIINNKLEILTWAISQQYHEGWQNNEGGYGHVIFNVSSRKAFLVHTDYVQETVDHGKVEVNI